MLRKLKYIWHALILLLVVVGCDVHEFPEERYENVPFKLHLNFTTEMTLYKEIGYTRGENMDDGSSAAFSHDIRYIVKAFRELDSRNENRVADTTFVFTKADILDLNYTAQLYLPEGDYTFRVWADYVEHGTMSDKYYDTRNFEEIILPDPYNHVASTDFRDAFRGDVTASVINTLYYTPDAAQGITNEATVEMSRPMGKYQFISTDLDAFITRVIDMMKEREAAQQGSKLSQERPGDMAAGKSMAAFGPVLGESSELTETQNINIRDFNVVMCYNGYMPCSYNMFTRKPAFAWNGITYKSKMRLLENNEVELGFDYIFVNGNETTVSVWVEVYDKDGVLMSKSKPEDVQIVRSKLTVVRGEFLSSKASGGVSIDPGYEGDDYNIKVD